MVRSILSLFSAILSIMMIPIPAAYETQHTMNPKNIAPPNPTESARGGSIKLFTTDPNQDTVMFKPKAKASSFPKNHQLTTTV
jgi:hypothetical protein